MFDRFDCAALQSGSSIPLHHQLTVLLRNKILSGAVAPDEKLPSEKSLTQTFGVSRITVSRALRTLAAQGLVEKRRGTGNFVAPTAQRPSVLVEPFKLATFLQSPHHWLTQVTVRKSATVMPEIFCVNAPVNSLLVTPVAMASLALQIGDPVVTVQRRYLADDGAVLAATMFQFRPDRVDLELIPAISGAIRTERAPSVDGQCRERCAAGSGSARQMQ